MIAMDQKYMDQKHFLTSKVSGTILFHNALFMKLCEDGETEGHVRIRLLTQEAYLYQRWKLHFSWKFDGFSLKELPYVAPPPQKKEILIEHF